MSFPLSAAGSPVLPPLVPDLDLPSASVTGTAPSTEARVTGRHIETPHSRPSFRSWLCPAPAVRPGHESGRHCGDEKCASVSVSQAYGSNTREAGDH